MVGFHPSPLLKEEPIILAQIINFPKKGTKRGGAILLKGRDSSPSRNLKGTGSLKTKNGTI